ncbi:hypothetical protein FHX34_105779 [Actinoplanes teichomyceticus]|uniref:Dehydratase n=1 Tax=Actinoplanes teichomyceticus TaxID=1867 RepID=A0A561VMR6_ACTTI|nr:hypothetical protein FHX34_105779 [Actinoplanes teichomyceticus]
MGATLATLAAVAAAGCAAAGTAGAAAVPAGCDPSGATVHWSTPVRQPRLTRVDLFASDAGGTGTVVLDEPITASVAGVTAPDGWVAALAASLSTATGSTVRTGPVRLPDGGYSMLGGAQDDPSIPESLLYQGVETITADFTVDCAPPVTGTFTSWTTTGLGTVACAQADEPAEPLGRLARRHCPRTPAPHPPALDLAPSPTVPPPGALTAT